jgi:hypothetical protein
MKRWLLVCAAAFTLAACGSDNSEEAIWEKHDYYMDNSAAYQKAFKYKMDALGKDRTEEEVFEAITQLVESKEDADKAWNGK